MPLRRAPPRRQLTLHDISTRTQVNEDHQNSNAVPRVIPTRRSSRFPVAPLPKPTAPAKFLPTPVTHAVLERVPVAPTNPSPALPDDVWDVARDVYDASARPDSRANQGRPFSDQNPRPSRISQPNSSRSVCSPRQGFQSSNDDDDFQSDDNRSTPRARSSKIRYPISPLRDDRPSMTRRSAKKSKTRVANLVQTPTLVLSDDTRSDQKSPIALNSNTDADRIPMCVTTLFKDNHSELSSGTDREDPPDHLLSAPPSPFKSQAILQQTRPVSSVVEAPSRVISVDCSDHSQTPPEFSLAGSDVQCHGDNVRRSSRRNAPQTAPAPTGKSTTDQANPSPSSTMRRRGRRLVSLFANALDDSDEELKMFKVSTSTERPGSSKRVIPDPPRPRRLIGTKRTSCSSENSELIEVPRKQLFSSRGLDSTRNRRRVLLSSSSEEEEPSTPKPNLPIASDPFCTPIRKRPLPDMVPHAATEKNPELVRNDIDIIRDVENDQYKTAVDEANEKGEIEADSRRTRSIRSRRRQGNKSAGVLDVTPSASPSPPSTRKKGRFAKLQTRVSSNDSFAGAPVLPMKFTQLEKGKEATTDATENVLMDGGKPNEWFFERDIGEFSSSSSGPLDSKRTPVGSHSKRCSRTTSQGTLQLSQRPKPKAVERCIVAEFSDNDCDSKDVVEVESINNSPTQSPRNTNPDAEEIVPGVGFIHNVDDDETGARIGNGVGEVLDLIDVDDDDDDFEIPSTSIVRSCREAERIEDSMEIEEVDVRDPGPPPFNLHALCEGGEGVIDMMERVGEARVLEMISDAQKDGRRIIGGDELGLDQTFNTNVFDKYSRTVVASDIAKDRAGKSDLTERALRGEYQFSYRGRKSVPTTDGSRGRGRGGGRGKGRGFPFRKRGGAGARRRA